MAVKKKSSRRAFLTGQAAVDAVSDLLPAEESLPPPPAVEDQRPSLLLQVGRTAMACEFEVLLNDGDPPDAAEVALEALDLVDQLEDQLSWFREHSELSRLNRDAATAAVAVELRLFGLIAQAVELHHATGGAFDITAGPLWQLWGFHRREGKLPTDDDIATAMQRVGSNLLQLDRESNTVRFLQPGMEINLGAIGKGHALDRCADVLADGGVDDFLIHGGQSSMLARGKRRGRDASLVGWRVAVRHPLRQSEVLLEVDLRDQALGTSGSGNQFFHFEGKRYGHVLDPRTGRPAMDVLSATVLAPTAAEADALSTAFFVMGVKQSRDYCEKHPGVGVIFVCPSDSERGIEVVPHGISDGQWRDVSDD